MNDEEFATEPWWVVVTDDGLYLTAVGSWTFSYDRSAAREFRGRATAEAMCKAMPPSWGVNLTVIKPVPGTVGPTKPGSGGWFVLVNGDGLFLTTRDVWAVYLNRTAVRIFPTRDSAIFALRGLPPGIVTVVELNHER